MTDEPTPGLFASTSAFTQPDQPAPPAITVLPPIEVGQITFAHTARLKEIADILELARDASVDSDLIPLLDEALDLARRP